MTINEIKRENGMLHLEIVLCSRDFDKYFAYCEDCGEIVLKEKAIELDGDYYCSDCIISCDTCGCLHPRRYSHTVEDCDCNYYCSRCYEEECYVCSDCGRHYRYSDSVTTIDGCFYCEHCVEEHRSPIESYHTFKSSDNIEFYGTEDRSRTPYMGLELEVDTDQRIDRASVINRFKDDFGDFLHYEEDGSLRFGWENISQPASFSYHLGIMDKYKKWFEILTEEGLRSHDTNSCGLHIHIDRRYFGKNEDSSIGKLLYIFERFRNELMVFSRRTEYQANDWARSRKQSNTKSGWIKKAVIDSKQYCEHSERYYAVNLINSETIEIRLWRGTLNNETFEATLKFTARLAELCKNTRVADIAKMTFEDLIGSDEVILSYWNRVKNRTTIREEEF